MKLISENGKDYLETYVVKESNTKINANKLFMDVEELIYKILKKTNSRKSFIDKKLYGGNLQLLLNRFSGDSCSPSFLKSYTTNPALTLMNNFFSDSDDTYIRVGNVFHKIMENYFNLKEENRTKENLLQLMDEEIKKDELVQTKLIKELVDGYLKGGDYLKEGKKDSELKCLTEKYGSDFLYVKSLDTTIPIRLSYVLDRVDFRNGGLYIVDYKTSKNVGDGASFDGYLSSMLIYKWAAEQLFNKPVKGGFLSYPRTKEKYVELDFSKESEEKLLEKINSFLDDIKKSSRLRTYTYTDKGYFNTKDTSEFRRIMNDSLLWDVKIPVRIYIGEEKDRP